jgi:hypothetical protein
VVTIAMAVASATNLIKPTIGISWSEIIRKSPLTSPAVQFDQLDSVPLAVIRRHASDAGWLWPVAQFESGVTSVERGNDKKRDGLLMRGVCTDAPPGYMTPMP